MNIAHRPTEMVTELDDRPKPEVAPVLTARGLHKAFGGNVILNHVDLTLHQGEVVLLRGENGSGKTTLINILSGNLEPDSGTINYLLTKPFRSHSFPRRWWWSANPFDQFAPEIVSRDGIGRTWQDVRLFGSLSLCDNIAVAYPNQLGESSYNAVTAFDRVRRREASMQANANASLAQLGLAGRERSSADKISLGQSKRVAIARAVAAGARILFLDEPLAGLDDQGISEVLALLKDLVRIRHITLVIIEHVFNQIHLRDLVTTDWILENGRIVQNNACVTAPMPAAFFPENSTPDSCAPPIVSFKPQWFSILAGPEADVVDEPLPAGAVLTRIRRKRDSREPPDVVLEVRDLVVQRGSHLVVGKQENGNLIGFDLTLHDGEIAIIQAPNGWGKTTLLMNLIGLVPGRRGTVKLDGVDLAGFNTSRRVRAGLRFTPSQGALFPSLTEAEVLKLAKSSHLRTPRSAFNRKIGALSGGQRQLLALAASRAIGRANLFDEPFAGLDIHSARKAAIELLTSANGCTLIAIPLVTRPHDQPRFC